METQSTKQNGKSAAKELQSGDKIPTVTVILQGVEVDLAHYFRNKVGVIFGVPGAFTRTCSERHIPGFRDNAETLNSQVDFVGCVAVNDPYVLKAWANELKISDQFVFMADYNGELSRRLSVLTMFDKERLGQRCRRFAMICGDGQVQWVGFDEDSFYEKVAEELKARPHLLKGNRKDIQSMSLAALGPSEPLVNHEITYRGCGPSDVHIKVKYCGVCHTDCHLTRDEWGTGIYPMVPGHEVVGIVEAVGSAVKKFQVGDKAAAGFVVDSCRRCVKCKSGLEHYCEGKSGWRAIYNSRARDGVPNYGGFAKDLVVDENYVIHWPDKLDMCAGSPLMCAGITVYSPLVNFGGNKPGAKVGVLGFGGLGHMAVKFGKALGAEVVVISRTDDKRDDAMKMGADRFVLSTSEDDMESLKGYLNVIIDCVGARKDLNMYLNLLKVDGTLALCGIPPKEVNYDVLPIPMIFSRRRVTGTFIGSFKEFGDMLQLAAEKQILADVEVIPATEVNSAFERMNRSDVRYRFVLDVESLPDPAAVDAL